MTERRVEQETVTLQEYRDRAQELSNQLEDTIVGYAPELRIAEALLALHLVQRRLECSLKLCPLSAEDQALLLAQVESQRVSFDAFLAAEQAKANEGLQ